MRYIVWCRDHLHEVDLQDDDGVTSPTFWKYLKDKEEAKEAKKIATMISVQLVKHDPKKSSRPPKFRY